VWHDPQGAREDYAIGHVIGAMLRGIFGGTARATLKWLWTNHAHYLTVATPAAEDRGDLYTVKDRGVLLGFSIP
jgi:hypothetical protein